MLHFSIDNRNGSTLDLLPNRLVIAGWTGRDAAAIEHHIEELARVGVARPSAVPLYYRVSHTQLTQQTEVEVLGDTSSGEVEPVLLHAAGRWWLTLGSDHTDRAVEAYSVVVSKQMCAKPIARTAWAWDEVAARADGLELHSEVFESGGWVSYQRGPLARIRPLTQLIAGLPADAPVADGLVLFCGTLGAIPDAQGRGVRPATRMRLAMIDAQANRRIEHEYTATSLPMVA